MTRSVLSISGNDRFSFLQGLVTNDVNRLAEDNIQYTALLTPQGKLIATFFLVHRDNDILIDLPSVLAHTLTERLSLYKLRAAVEITETDHAVSRGTGEAPVGALADPRHAALGWRLYSSASGDDGTDWDALRVAHLIPEWGRELGPESYILEMGFERLHGVDFRKGCYVGQEVTARMKHKTELRKGLARVSLSGTVSEGALITSEGREVGRIGTVSGDQALAYLRFDRAKGPLQADGSALSLDPLGP